MLVNGTETVEGSKEWNILFEGKTWNLIWTKFIPQESTQEFMCKSLTRGGLFLCIFRFGAYTIVHVTLSHIRQLLFMGCVLWGQFHAKRLFCRKDYRTEQQIWTMSIKARIWCVHIDDLYSAYFLEKNYLPCALN